MKFWGLVTCSLSSSLLQLLEAALRTRHAGIRSGAVAVCCQQGRCLVDGLSVRKFTDLQHALGPSSGYPSQWPWSAKGEADAPPPILTLPFLTRTGTKRARSPRKLMTVASSN